MKPNKPYKVSKVSAKCPWKRTNNGLFVVIVPHFPVLNGYGKSLGQAQRRARRNLAEYYSVKKRMVKLSLGDREHAQI